MKPENLKLLLRSYIECKQNQDDFDVADNLAVEFDNPLRPCPFGGENFAQGAFMGPPNQFPLNAFLSESTPSLPNNVVRAGRELARMARQFSASEPDNSIIQFGETCMIKEPVEQIITIPIIRKQNFSEHVTKVSWKTCDKTALSGTHYIKSSGKLIFNQGETNKDIQIKILNSNDGADDLRFLVELNYDGELYTPKPLTVSLKKITNLEPTEKTVLDSLPRFLSSIYDIKYALDGCLNARTFHMALTYLCSTSNAVDHQIALACELSYLCLHKSSGCSLRPDTILRVLSDFFRMDDYEF